MRGGGILGAVGEREDAAARCRSLSPIPKDDIPRRRRSERGAQPGAAPPRLRGGRRGVHAPIKKGRCRMYEEITAQARAAVCELLDAAGLREG